MNEPATSVMVMGYNGVALEGNIVSFSCSSGLILSGSNSSTCMGNGEWEPDPRRSACHNKSHHNNNICRSMLDHKTLLGVHNIILYMWRLLYRKDHIIILLLSCSYIVIRCCYATNSKPYNDYSFI